MSSMGKPEWRGRRRGHETDDLHFPDKRNRIHLEREEECRVCRVTVMQWVLMRAGFSPADQVTPAGEKVLRAYMSEGNQFWTVW